MPSIEFLNGCAYQRAKVEPMLWARINTLDDFFLTLYYLIDRLHASAKIKIALLAIRPTVAREVHAIDVVYPLPGTAWLLSMRKFWRRSKDRGCIAPHHRWDWMKGFR